MAITSIVVYIIYAPSIVIYLFFLDVPFLMLARAAIDRNSRIVKWRCNKSNIIILYYSIIRTAFCALIKSLFCIGFKIRKNVVNINNTICLFRNEQFSSVNFTIRFICISPLYNNIIAHITFQISSPRRITSCYHFRTFIILFRIIIKYCKVPILLDCYNILYKS